MFLGISLLPHLSLCENFIQIGKEMVELEFYVYHKLPQIPPHFPHLLHLTHCENFCQISKEMAELEFYHKLPQITTPTANTTPTTPTVPVTHTTPTTW